MPLCFCFINTPRTNAHQLACHHHHSRCAQRQHKHKLRTLPATCTPYQQSFYVRCIPPWNALTEEAVTASTAEVFQRAAVVVPDSTQSRIRLNAYRACARMRNDNFLAVLTRCDVVATAYVMPGPRFD